MPKEMGLVMPDHVTQRKQQVEPLYFHHHPFANQRLDEAYEKGFATARRHLIRWNVAMVLLLLLLVSAHFVHRR